jgi:putative membrane protein
MRNVVLAGVATVALLGWQASAVAQSGQSETASGQTTSGSAHAKAKGKAQGAKTEGAAESSGQPDHAFVMEAASGGMMEVELGRMAGKQASNDDVKKFGQRMVDDHGKANNDLSALAQKKNIKLPAEMEKKHAATRDHLSKLNGAAFDKAYMQHMVTDHTQDVAAFQREAKTGKDPDVKAWAGQVLPTLQDHLRNAKQVSSELGGTHPTKPGKGEKKK